MARDPFVVARQLGLERRKVEIASRALARALERPQGPGVDIFTRMQGVHQGRVAALELELEAAIQAAADGMTTDL